MCQENANRQFCVEVNGDIIEDGCLLHLAGDGQHIDLVELDGLKGINLVCHRKAMVLLLVTDFVFTTGSWISN